MLVRKLRRLKRASRCNSPDAVRQRHTLVYTPHLASIGLPRSTIILASRGVFWGHTSIIKLDQALHHILVRLWSRASHSARPLPAAVRINQSPDLDSTLTILHLECQRKKKRCSKDIPCSRCIDLGLSCDRDVVYLRRNVARHASEIKFLQSLQAMLQSTSSVDKALYQVKSRLEHLQSGRHLATSPTELGAEGSDDAVASGLDETSTTSSLEPSPIITALEQVARGRSSGRCCHHYSQNCPCGSSTASVSTMQQPPISTIDLPGREVAQVLVDFHIKHMAWHHNSLHTPTFLRECTVFWDTGECDNPQWIALYCAVLAVSLFSFINSPSHRELFLMASSFSQHTPSLLFDKMVGVLDASHFLQNLSLYSVQAIAISAEVAHSLGRSQLNTTLFNAAIGIAECLGLHKIPDDSSEAASEIGRRVWHQLIIQDHFAISFVGSYKIHPLSYSSLPPSNADDDLVAMPDSVPTASTYNRTLLALARLMPELADGLGPLRDPTPVRDKYRHIIAMDQKLRKCVQEFPAYLRRRDKQLEARIPWLGVARHSMAITVAEKVNRKISEILPLCV